MSLLASQHEHHTSAVVQQFFPIAYKGIYVDIGSAYPEWISNSHWFRKLGWNVIPIEPNPRMCQMYRDRNYHILEYACTGEDLGETDFEILDYSNETGGSALKVLDPAGCKVTPIKVQGYTLNTIMTKHHPEISNIDVLDIDVEGYELLVFKGIDIKRFNPSVLVVENVPFKQEYLDYYERIGYRKVTHASFNDICLKIEDLHKFGL